ncbi:MAG: FtsK/SpoIIIE domain-containing protein [Chloroflexi bacterium]|nr:FtsK/SpoIIIE domain-containing protein [Chloroflexota bacterium]
MPDRRPSAHQGLALPSPEATAEIQALVAELRDRWTWPEGKRPFPPIQGLPAYLELEALWQSHPLPPKPFAQPTAVLGLAYQRLDPIWIEFNLLEQFNLVIGPAQSGKTEFLMSLALATAVNIPPQQMDILVFALQPGHPLRLLRGLPHVRLASSLSQAQELLARLHTDLQERAAAQKNLADLDQTVTTKNDLISLLPKRTPDPH